VAVPTEYVRGTVIQAYGVDPARVVVVPHGVESTLGASATAESTLRERYHLGNGRVLVFPAVTHPHKGHRFLLEVLSRYWHEDDLQLVMIGGFGRAEDQVRRSIRELGLEGRALRLGRVSSADRDGLVRMAFALVFPSQYEGFGAPVLEAMAMGVPVICSNSASLPEVAGNAALILPLESAAWATALENVTAKRSEMVQAGLARVRRFTARTSAEMLVKAYELALQ
jgi:alpha-1,3-rhamnosyl/mannosyltransferase